MWTPQGEGRIGLNQRGTFRYNTVTMASIVRRIPKDIWDLAVDSARAHNWDKGVEEAEDDEDN
jgi:hypothetical protein